MTDTPTKKPTIYVITAYEINHNSPGYRNHPLDDRFVKSDRNYVYFLIDDHVPAPLEGKQVLHEKQIDPELAQAGKNHLAEWSFLLMEEKNAFCEYPFFIISSRFYEKNTMIKRDLNQEWDKIFDYLEQYGWGYLPSYDRPLTFIDYEWTALEKYGKRYTHFPFTKKTFTLINDLYGVAIPAQYRRMSDLTCNYIGFKSRQELVDYIAFYKPLINALFDEKFEPKVDLSEYVRHSGGGTYRNEKPFTFYLEWMSHLFFYKNSIKMFAYHYEGYFEVDERDASLRLLEPVTLPGAGEMRWRQKWNLQQLLIHGALKPISYPILWTMSLPARLYSRMPLSLKAIYRKMKASIDK